MGRRSRSRREQIARRIADAVVPYEAIRGEIYSLSTGEALPPDISRRQHRGTPDIWFSLNRGVPGGSVYPWSPQRRLAIHTVSPFRSAAALRRSLDPALTRLQIRVPARVKFCQQRKVRREVLFAMRRAGYSGSAKKRYWRRSQNSQYRC